MKLSFGGEHVSITFSLSNKVAKSYQTSVDIVGRPQTFTNYARHIIAA